MTFSGVRPGGEEILLPSPVRAQFDSARDAPADSFQGVFPLGKSPGVLTGLKIRGARGETLFSGIADIQRESSSGSGNLLRLTCRGLAGLLLDSEAVPRHYSFPSLPVIFERHVKPYGFSGYRGDGRAFQGTLRIAKGMSEWQAAAAFCKNFLGVAPRVRGDCFDASGETAGSPIRFDNLRGVRYFGAEVKNRCCDRISEIFVPDGDTGAYRSAAKDAETAALGILRNRCLSGPSADADAVLKAACRKAFAVTVDCPGAPAAETGAPAELRDPLLGAYGGLSVAAIRCVADADGTRTRYVLRKA